MLQSTVQQYPENIAVVQGQHRINYCELGDLCSLTSAVLVAKKIGAGIPVAVIFPNEPGFIMAYYSLALLNAIAVPLNPELKNEELDFFIREANARHIITNKKLRDRFEKYFSGISADIKVISLDYETELEQVRVSAIPIPAALPVSNSDHFMYYYSSGSTGLPKRMSRTQANCVSIASTVAISCNVTETDRIFCSIPLYHGYGMGSCMNLAIRSGATLVIMEDPQPFVLHKQRALNLLESEKITIFPGIPFQFEALCKVNRSRQFPALRLCFSSGSKLKDDTFDTFLEKFNIPIRQVYGSVETSIVCINLDENPSAIGASSGRPLHGISIEIWDSDHKSVPNGQEGEVAIKSPAMTSGYHNMDELNRRVFINGFFLPGDIGRFDSEGRLFITGRKRKFIEVVGHKVDPETIEKLLLQKPGVREVMVVGTSDEKTGREKIKAVIVADKSCTREDILDYCKQHLASFEIPEIIDIRDGIERDPVGKVKIRTLVD